jgi:hypothetical protein
MINMLSWCFLGLGFSLLATVSRDTPLPFLYLYEAIYAIGAGSLYLGRTLAIQASHHAVDVPMATSMISFFSSVGQAFGVAVGGVLYRSSWQDEITTAVETGQLPHQHYIPATYFEQVSSTLDTLPEDVQAAYGLFAAAANKELFVALAALAGLGFLGTLCSKNLSLDNSEDIG